MAEWRHTGSGALKNTNEEIERRLIRRATLTAQRDARLGNPGETNSPGRPASGSPDRPVSEAPDRLVSESRDRRVSDGREHLISEAAARASINSFSELSHAAKNVPLPVRSPGIGNAGRTIEKLIAELIRPPLHNWLRENLPPMVERLVQDEVRVQSREWIDEKLPPIVERLARQTLREMLSRAAGRRAA